MRVLCDLGIENDLRQPVPIPKVDENQATQIPPPVDPPTQHNILTGVVRPQRATREFSGYCWIDIAKRGHTHPFW
jgi:hypothetical protein